MIPAPKKMPRRFLSSTTNGDRGACQRRNEEIIRRRCLPVEVSPDELANCVAYFEPGKLDPEACRNLVEALIARGEHAMTARTLGL